MNFINRSIAVVCTLLIAAGFSLSGFHYHDERNPEAGNDEVSIVHELDFCLLCEGISYEQPESSASAEITIPELGEVLPTSDSFFSPLVTLVQNSRAPPVLG